jgi:DNA-binding NtrC family response regulator
MVSSSDSDDSAHTAVRGASSEPRPRSFRLRVAEGPDAGAEHIVDGTEPAPILIGQSPACALRLTDQEVSRRHAEVELAEGRLRVRDLRSTNGTWIEDVAVLDAFAHGGESIRLGSTVIRVLVEGGVTRGAMDAVDRFGRFLGQSLEMRRLYPLVAKLAKASIPIVIEGETGTGKEVLAEAIHEASPRAQGPFVVLDCTALPPTLAEAELFGHEKGAFTNALGTRRGVFERAHGGTLFIDEIGDLDLSLQPKLLRAIERSEVRRVGADDWQRVDVRVLAATRRDLDHEVAAGRFRDDLFHRLAVARVELPALRKRKSDIPLLAHAFYTELGGKGALPAALVARWSDDAWPGNVRELRNAVARAIVVGTDDVLPDDYPSSVTSTADFIDRIVAEKRPLPMARLEVVAELERRYISRVLAEHGGNVSRAAEASGIGRRYFQMLKKKGET